MFQASTDYIERICLKKKLLTMREKKKRSKSIYRPLSLPEGIQHWEKVEKGCVTGVTEPGFDRDGIV